MFWVRPVNKIHNNKPTIHYAFSCMSSCNTGVLNMLVILLPFLGSGVKFDIFISNFFLINYIIKF